MNDETDHATDQRTWLDRLSHALLREPQDRAQLVDLLRDAEKRHLLDPDALSMIEGVFQVSEMQVRDILIPRSQMVIIEEDQELSEFLPRVIESTHSRFPVVGDNRDEIIGILHAKDLLKYVSQNPSDDFAIRDIMRPAIHVPESKRLDALLKDFRNNHNHMAVVADEYGGVCGVVTIEDVLEQIVGEIADEFDVDEDLYIKQHSETEYIVKALTPIEEFNQFFHTQLDEQEFDTIGGLVIHQFGHMPKRGEKIELASFQFEVLNADKRRIHLLQLQLLSPPKR